MPLSHTVRSNVAVRSCLSLQYIYSAHPYFAIDIPRQVRWLRPTSLTQLLTMKQAFPNARMVGGNTEVGIEMRANPDACTIAIAPTHVAELTEVRHNQPIVTC